MEDISSVATEEMSSVATEEPPAVFWTQKVIPFSLKARCEVPRLPPAVFWALKMLPFSLNRVLAMLDQVLPRRGVEAKRYL